MNTKIVVDSSASLYTLQGVDFECVPLKIITDDAEYLDNGTMDAVGMAQTLRTYKGKTSTSCPNVSDWLAWSLLPPQSVMTAPSKPHSPRKISMSRCLFSLA